MKDVIAVLAVAAICYPCCGIISSLQFIKGKLLANFKRPLTINTINSIAR